MTAAQQLASKAPDTPQRVAALVRQKLGSHRMDLWFGADAKWSVLDHNVVLEVSSQFVADCITRMFRGDLQEAIEEVAGNGFGYRILVRDDQSSIARGLDSSSTTDAFSQDAFPHNKSSVPTIAPSINDEPALAPKRPALRLHRSEVEATVSQAGVSQATVSQASVEPEQSNMERLAQLRRENERRWEEFIPGEHNRLVYTAANMTLEKPGQISPLFIFGPHGCGKSHLAIGLAHRLKVVHRMRRVLVLTGEQFTIEFTESARGGGFASFRRKYRDVDVLVIDDLQFCLGKNATLAELRNTIDMLLRDKKQVILVADRSLNELTGLSSDLHARLAGGMACGMEPLDVETRTKLLVRLCHKQNVSIDESTAKQLAAQSSGDARVLQGVVHRLVVQQRIQGQPLEQDQAIRATLDLIRASQPVVRLKDIERVVSDVFGLEDSLLKAKTKCQSVSQPRMLAMFLARKYTRAALSEIGEYFGNRQHSTVISAQKKVDSWLNEDEIIQCGRGKLTVKEILKTLESSLRVS
ncbi:MAG: DnaA/Hda family protein [Pirellula sp.]|jgi:chromosomal replication initiator protein|nr:DnaA/Hda family protein [Pirellula sp.]